MHCSRNILQKNIVISYIFYQFYDVVLTVETHLLATIMLEVLFTQNHVEANNEELYWD